MKQLYLLFILVFMLAACGGDEKKEEQAEENQQTEATLQVFPPVGTVVPGCELAELENWYEMTNANSLLFQDDALVYMDLGPESAAEGLDRLMTMQEAMVAVPVPECVNDVNSLIHMLMESTLEDFRQYSAGVIQQGELQERTRQNRARYDNEVRLLLQQTETQLMERLQSNGN